MTSMSKTIENGVVTLDKGESAQIVTPDAVKKNVGMITVNSCSKESGKYLANVTVKYNSDEKSFDLVQATSLFYKDLTLRLESGTETGSAAGVTIHVLFNVQ